MKCPPIIPWLRNGDSSRIRSNIKHMTTNFVSKALRIEFQNIRCLHVHSWGGGSYSQLHIPCRDFRTITWSGLNVFSDELWLLCQRSERAAHVLQTLWLGLFLSRNRVTVSRYQGKPFFSIWWIGEYVESTSILPGAWLIALRVFEWVQTVFRSGHAHCLLYAKHSLPGRRQM